MTAPLGPFPNWKQVIRDVLTSIAEVATATPEGFTGQPAMLRIRGIGGGDDLISDSPTFDIDALSLDEKEADDLAEQARQLLIFGPQTTAHGVIDRVVTLTRPHVVPYSPSIYNATAAYRITLRRRHLDDMES